MIFATNLSILTTVNRGEIDSRGEYDGVEWRGIILTEVECV